MADEEDLHKGPLVDRLSNKNWKVRRAAFEELQQKFKEATDNAIFDEYGTVHVGVESPKPLGTTVLTFFRTSSTQIQEDHRGQERSSPRKRIGGSPHMDRSRRKSHKVPREPLPHSTLVDSTISRLIACIRSD